MCTSVVLIIVISRKNIDLTIGIPLFATKEMKTKIMQYKSGSTETIYYSNAEIVDIRKPAPAVL